MARRKLVTEETLAYFKSKLDLSITQQITVKSPQIGENGNWIINGEDTGVTAGVNEANTVTIPQIHDLFTTSKTE